MSGALSKIYLVRHGETACVMTGDIHDVTTHRRQVK